MSVEHEAILYLGFPVTRSDFLEETSETSMCPQGHGKLELSGPYCSSCGGKYEVRKMEVPTEAFRALLLCAFQTRLSEVGSPTETFDSLWGNEAPCFELRKGDYFLGALVGKVSPNGHTTSRWLAMPTLQEGFGRVEALREAVGMVDREIQLILVALVY